MSDNVMKKILCIADSFGLPRVEVAYECTWYYRVKLALGYSEYDYLYFFKRLLTTDVLVTMGGENTSQSPKGADCLEHYLPSVVVLQLGICDCAPRLFLKGSIEEKLVNRAPVLLRRRYIEAKKKLVGRKSGNALVSPKKFKANIVRYLERCSTVGVEKVIYIAIGTPISPMIDQNPGILDAIGRYNAILEELSEQYAFLKVIYPWRDVNDPDLYIADGYHPSALGHTLIATALIAELA